MVFLHMIAILLEASGLWFKLSYLVYLVLPLPCWIGGVLVSRFSSLWQRFFSFPMCFSDNGRVSIVRRILCAGVADRLG